MQSLSSVLITAGAVSVLASAALAISQSPLGSPLFFAVAAVMAAAYLLVLGRVWIRPPAPGRNARTPRSGSVSQMSKTRPRGAAIVRDREAAVGMRPQWQHHRTEPSARSGQG